MIFVVFSLINMDLSPEFVKNFYLIAIGSQLSKCPKFMTFREGCFVSFAIECKYLSEALETFYHH